jgi:glucose dehydrogenase
MFRISRFETGMIIFIIIGGILLLSMLLAACGNNKGAALQDPVCKILPDVKGGNIHKYGRDKLAVRWTDREFANNRRCSGEHREIKQGSFPVND